MPKNNIAQHLAGLPNLSKVGLCKLWNEFFGAPPSPHLRRNLMTAILAYRIQEEAFGSLSVATRNRLRQLARALETDAKSSIASVPTFKPGTRLVREWGAHVHLVSVEDDGYTYQGARYQTLHEIARLITGTRWSGPLFFGMKKQDTKKVRSNR
jgi:hypothetical protein